MDYTRNLITDSLVASAIKSAMVELSPSDVTNRGKIVPLVLKKLQESLDGKYGPGTVYIANITISQMDFDANYNAAIEAKSIAAQEQARAEIENKTAIARAEAEKQVAVLKAEADAEKIRIAAEAQAKANQLIQESLTAELIELKKIEAWDGKLPQAVGSDTLIGISTE